MVRDFLRRQNSKQLKDKHHVSESFIKEVYNKLDTISLQIKSISGEIKTYTCETNRTVIKLKQAIAAEEMIVIRTIQLMLDGKEMKNNVMLADYELKNGSIIHMGIKEVERLYSPRSESNKLEKLV